MPYCSWGTTSTQRLCAMRNRTSAILSILSILPEVCIEPFPRGGAVHAVSHTRDERVASSGCYVPRLSSHVQASHNPNDLVQSAVRVRRVQRRKCAGASKSRGSDVLTPRRREHRDNAFTHLGQGHRLYASLGVQCSPAMSMLQPSITPMSEGGSQPRSLS